MHSRWDGRATLFVRGPANCDSTGSRVAKDSSISRASGFLQRRRTVTAATLAERLEVSERTVGYTDGKKDGTSRVVRP
ncbi:MAG TPA: HTH domain-containing protein, partial [Polyangia bacterium]